MEAIILAGGFGTRLKDVISNIPKPMAPINGEPFLTYLLEYLKHYGVNRVVIATGFKGSVIIEHYGYRYEDIEIVYSEEKVPLGTGGAIAQALKLVSESYVFVLNGDTYFEVDIKKVKKPKNISIVLKFIEETSRYGSVQISNNRVQSFKEKQLGTSGYINGGIYYLRKDLFDEYELPTTFSFESDFLLEYTNQLEIEYLISDSYFIDIGIPEDYLRAQEELKVESIIFR